MFSKLLIMQYIQERVTELKKQENTNNGFAGAEKRKYIGEIFEVYDIKNLAFGLTPIYIFKETRFIDWYEENLEIIKSISPKDSALKVIEKNLIKVNKEIEKWTKEKERLESMKTELQGVD